MPYTDAHNSLASSPTPRRPSGVSTALRGLDEKPDTTLLDARAEMGGWREGGFRLRVVSNSQLRLRANALRKRIYRACGYGLSDDQSAGDFEGPSVTLLVEDGRGRDSATISLAYDGSLGLPCDEVFGPETESLRRENRRLVEVTRLSIESGTGHSKMLLARLFNFIYIHARKIRGANDFLIEVNPRHEAYYRRLLGFTRLGPCRPCPRVNGAPAVLLRLDLAHPEREIRRLAGKEAVPNATGKRSLYRVFFSGAQEANVAEFLSK